MGLKRKDPIILLVKGKTALHIIAAGTSFCIYTMQSKRRLRRILSAHAKSLVAIDIDE